MHRKILYTALALVMMAAMLPSPALPTAQAAPPAQPEAPNVLDTNRDEFESQSYGNNDGSQNWAGNWIETNDGGSPTGGDIQITTGGELRIDNSGGNLPSIRRAVNANMASAQYATLSFEYRTAGGLEYDDELAVEVSVDGGTTYTTLEIFHENNTGSRIYGISEFISPSTVIRFRVNNGITDSGEYYYLDNVQVSYDTAALKTYHDIGWEGGILGDNNNRAGPPAQVCSEPAVLYFSIYDDFTITDLNVGINVTHIARGDVRVTLDSPAGTTRQIVADNNTDTDNNYDILVDDASGAPIDDGSADDIGETYYDRTVGPSTNGFLDAYNGENAKGVWKLVICDAHQDDGSRSGVANHATLFFTGTDNPAPPPPGGESSGPTAQVYYVPFPEDQVKLMMDTVYPHDGPSVPSACVSSNPTSQTFNTNPKNPVVSRTGFAILYDNTVLYYDHYEDGYETDLTTRTQQNTEHWGDGDLTNGVAPLAGGAYDADDILEKGDVVVIADVIQTEFAGQRIEYDARDRIGATAPVAVTRAAWSSGSSTLLAGALEVYPTNRWGLEYELPVGEDDDVNDMFEYVGVSILAQQNNTTVTIDPDGPGGAASFNFILNEGDSHQENGGLDLGATISADKPIQVDMITADVCAFFESRWYTLFPTDQWDDSYFVPVGTKTTAGTTPPGINDDVPTYAHVYNPNASTITVNWETQGPTAQTPFNVPAGGRVNRTIPNGQAAHFYTTGGALFNVVATVDSEAASGSGDDRNDTTDWGFAVVPESQMSSLFLSSLAPGYDPEYVGTAFNNASPLFVTAYNSSNLDATTDICVDYNTDGGANIDAGTGFEYDELFTITDLDSVKLYDNSDGDNDKNTGDLDQSAMFVFVCNGTSGIITAAWGQDPDEATGGRPAIDVGTTVPSLVPFAISKDADLAVDVNGNDLYDPGDTVEYEIRVFNAGTTDIPAGTLVTYDEVPANTTYVANTTEYEQPDTTVLPIGDGAGNTLPLTNANGGFTYPHILAIGESFYIRFQVEINVPFPLDLDRILNEAVVTDGIFKLEADVEIPVQEPLLGAIGNYVWFDEDGDGDQDAGEYGIPNVEVELWQDLGAGYVLVATTYTDANGGYLFPDLPPGDYRVDVIASTLPDPDGGGLGGLHQTYDEDDGATGTPITPHSTEVSLGSGEEHLTADFGYNWAPPNDTNNPPLGALGAIGDRVWLDADGDGVQDAGEAGIPGVTVELWYDSDSDGDIDAQYGSTTTNGAGNYIFDELPPGIYEVRIPTPPAGYNQTGDPDQYGVTCTACDNITTTPIVLGPGDVFLNADFGYQVDDVAFSIGNTVFFDVDADGTYEPNGNDGNAGTTADNEYGIAGVTVALIQDNGNGTYEPGVDPIVATTTTDANGQYLFSGLPNGTQYFVWVNDTENVLGEVQQSAEPGPSDGGVLCSACNDISPNVVPVGPDNLFQDFGYTPAGQGTNFLGAIGDTVFLDANNDSAFQQGEGLEGVVVALFDTNNIKLAQTVTDENGHYYFGDLDPTQTYVVQVQTSTLPNGGAGLTNHVDPDGPSPGDSISTVDLSLSPNGINLDQDFGYRPTSAGSIGNYIWEDTNADGVNNEPATNGIDGVTVDLYEDNNGNGIIDSGDHLVGQTTTASDGSYLFTQLPPGDYLVDVTDDNQVLNGYWHSLGDQTPGADDESKQDPHAVTLAAGEDYVAADFGYYVEPAAVGNFVWLDTNKDGIQDAGEAGIPNVVVKMTITYPNGDITVLTTVTDANGYYSFGNLLQDEDYNGAATYGAEPAYSISVDTSQLALAASPYPTSINASGSTAYNDSNDPAGTPALPVQGQTDTSAANDLADIASYDFGFTSTPLAVLLADFAAAAQADHILVTWETVSELDNAGFNLYRAPAPDGERTLVTSVPSAAPGAAQGASYSYQDTGVAAGQTYWYWLEDVSLGGTATLHGPVSAAIQSPTAVTLSDVQADSGSSSLLLWLVVVAAGLALAAAAGLRRRSITG